MSRTWTWTSTLTIGLTLAAVTPAFAVGVDSAYEVGRRSGVGVGAGWDHVGGYGQDGYAFVEAAAHVESRVWRRLYLAATAGYRQDVADHNFALGHGRGQRAATVTTQLLVGYDGPRFHLSAGPWLYGSRRDQPSFRVGLLPYGVVRLRAGSADQWHFRLHIADGAPFTSAGGALGLRALAGAPPRGDHRLAAGIYTSLGEWVAGLALYDEIAGVGPAGTALRVGGLIGTDLAHPVVRPELTLFGGLVW